MTLHRRALIALPGLAALTALGALAGCGTPTQPLAMTLATVDALQLRGWVPEVFKGQVGVAEVQGGEETGLWWGSKVSAQALQAALEDSLFAVGMRSAAPEPAPRFELRAELVQLDQPLIAPAGVTVTVTVAYTLTDRRASRVIYQRRLSHSEEAGFTEAMLSQPERTRIANERALRANITALLHDLVALRP